MEKNLYEYDENVKLIAQEVIKNEPKFEYINLDKVVFCKINKIIKSGHILGKISHLGKRAEFLTGKRFMMEMPEAFYDLNEKQKMIVVAHELCHIHEDNENLIDHDIGEFRYIIDTYGLDWYEIFKEGEINVKKKIEIEKLKKKLAKEESKNI